MTINGVDLRTLNKPQLFTMAMKYWRSNVEYSRRALKEYETLRAEIPEHALKKGDKFVIAREEVIKQIQTCMRTIKTEKEVEEIFGGMTMEKLRNAIESMYEVNEGATLNYLKSTTVALRYEINTTK
ncbi:hypothetical protein IKZ77_03120 [Candidatus Saccharibacteria bacterium]|nr:hypothetical protein [Candidatus Saccharibacteria bacterium]